MIFLLVIPLFVILLYLYGTRTYDYWDKRGVTNPKPSPFVGNYGRQFAQKASICMIATETYQAYPNEKVVGLFRGTRPELIIRDPDLIKRILITDFHSFHGRGLLPHRKVVEPLLRNLFFADGDIWKLTRQRVTPVFSTGKLKAMFHFITDRAEKLQKITEEVADREFYDVRELMARYTTDFIGACGFGLDIDSLGDENNQFRKLGRRIFYRSPKDALRAIAKYTLPELFKNVTLLDPEIEKSMFHLVKTVVNQRNNEPSGRNDFIDQMLELKKTGKLTGESIEHRNPDGTPKAIELEFDEIFMIAQVFVFFGAGFETSSSASSYTLHQLAFHPECQEKCQAEIDRVLAKYDNKITYDAIKEMTYLEKAFLEGMRLYPSVGYLVRQCRVPSYTFPEIDLTITENVKVTIPIQAIHRDPEYFSDPMTFNPERFDADVKNAIPNFAYLPFGDGPRACLGARLGQMQSMAGLAAVLHKFTVEPAACSVPNPRPDPKGIVSESFVGGLPLKIRKRNK